MKYVKYVLSAAALAMLATGPALAVGPDCMDQLTAIQGMMAQQPQAKASVNDKYNEALRLCNEHKDMQSEALAREIRDQLATSGGSGTSTPGGQSRANDTGGVRPETLSGTNAVGAETAPGTHDMPQTQQQK